MPSGGSLLAAAYRKCSLLPRKRTVYERWCGQPYMVSGGDSFELCIKQLSPLIQVIAGMSNYLFTCC